jgi:hypothetical protein
MENTKKYNVVSYKDDFGVSKSIDWKKYKNPMKIEPFEKKNFIKIDYLKPKGYDFNQPNSLYNDMLLLEK